jgi:hypothetical protein
MARAEQVPTHQDGVHLEEMAGESLLFNEANKKTIYLNDAASAIWKLCDGRRSVGELIRLLEQAYCEPDHDFAADVQATIGVLKWASQA